MTDDNPYKPASEIETDQDSAQPTGISSGHAAYNVVSDTVTGVNLRGSDNKFQAKFIFVSVILLAALGALLAWLNTSWELPWFGGAIAGAFAGLVFGVLASGIVLMVYRGARHMKGKHD